ncbi:hypothetical protein [Terrabacter sp. NPDC080008]|uniref:hypothetical protein n=1 Tax=Terrabacter sp. NPDC080008 TaxID=3155176 RepID=UPI00344B0D25
MTGGEVTTETGPVLRSRTVTLLVLAAAVAALLLASAAPMATAVVGLILFGLLGVVLELRYLVGRFSGLLTRPFLHLLAVLVTGVAGCRLIAGVAPGSGRLAEIVLGCAVLGVAAYHGLAGRRRVVAWAALAPVAAASLAFPSYYFLVLTHLHLLAPLLFLWDWSRRITSPRGRLAFRAVQVLWAVVVPLALLAGAGRSGFSADPGIVRSVVGDGHSVLASLAPPGTSPAVAVRVLVVFAFAQSMGYVVWVALFPRVAPDASASFEARVPWATPARLWAAGFVAAAVLAVLFGVDFDRGRALYAAVASYATYLELAVLLLLVLGGVAAPRRSGTVIRLPTDRTYATAQARRHSA